MSVKRVNGTRLARGLAAAAAIVRPDSRAWVVTICGRVTVVVQTRLGEQKPGPVNAADLFARHPAPSPRKRPHGDRH